MAIPLTELIAAGALGMALVSTVLAPWVERHSGAAFVPAMLVLAFFLLILAVLAGWHSVGWPGRVAAILAAALLLWSLLVYVAFRMRRAAAWAEMSATKPPAAVAKCRSRLTGGSIVESRPFQITRRSYIMSLYATHPVDNQLITFAKAWGGLFYLTFYLTREAVAAPAVAITCESVGSGCLAQYTPSGPTSDSDFPVAVQVVNTASRPAADQVRVIVTMFSTISWVAGAPMFTVGLAPGIPVPMGTYDWICDKSEGEQPH